MTTNRNPLRSPEIHRRIWRSLCDKRAPCMTSDIGSEFGLSIYQARYYLLQLCQEKKAQQVQSGRGRPALWLGVDVSERESQPAGNTSEICSVILC